MARHIIQQASESADGRRTAPAAERNTAPLTEALRLRLPARGRVLEVASGTGQHAAAFAAAFPDLIWIPSDVDAEQRKSIAAWRRASGLGNLEVALALDVAAPWPVAAGSVSAVLTINLLHLVPEDLVDRFFVEAHRVLVPGGRVSVYGPFLRGTTYASDGDRVFDAALRARDPAIGYKSVGVVTEIARRAELHPMAADALPANNLLLTFDRL